MLQPVSAISAQNVFASLPRNVEASLEELVEKVLRYSITNLKSLMVAISVPTPSMTRFWSEPGMAMVLSVTPT